MNKKDLKIIFMGTPEFAVGTLRRLVEDGYNIVAVVTQPDKPISWRWSHNPTNLSEDIRTTSSPLRSSAMLSSRAFQSCSR